MMGTRGIETTGLPPTAPTTIGKSSPLNHG